MKTLNPEYVRKTQVATQMADAAYINGGLDGMAAELAFLRRSDADNVVVATFARLYRKQQLVGTTEEGYMVTTWLPG